jgi:hypothetical protein
MGEMQVSKAPKKNRHTDKPAKELVAAVHVVATPHKRIITPKYLPIGSFCIRIELGYCAKRYPK